MFNGIDAKNIAEKSRKRSITQKEKIDLDTIFKLKDSFVGTEKNYKKHDKIELWKCYWLEYINAFDKLMYLLPESVVTIYLGRHAIELGIKYLILLKTGQIQHEHDLGLLSEQLFSIYSINDKYMNWVNEYCHSFCERIEGKNPEYFRYPEYNNNEFFAGNRLDVSWLSYNTALVLLKLLHFAGLESEF